MCLNETHNRVWVDKHKSDRFYIKNGLKKGHALLPLLLNFALDYAIPGVQADQEGLKLYDTHQLLLYANDVNILDGSMYTIKKKNTKAIVIASKETGLDVNAEKTEYMVMS
jgi:hypothetical protein